MRLIGKCPPEQTDFNTVADAGFDAVELYLNTAHLDEFEKTLQACKETPLEIAAVHTPHVSSDRFEYMQHANDLADKLGAFLSIHSTHLHIRDIPCLYDAVELTVDHGFENSQASGSYYRQAVIERGYPVTLDVAHWYLYADEFYDGIYNILTTGDVRHIHVCDARGLVDHLQFNEGDIHWPTVLALLDELYEGDVVLEVMPEEQATAHERVKQHLAAHL